MQKKIVLVGGPGTGKSSVLKELSKRGYTCMEEVSRQVTLKAQQDGIDQLFLEQPILFSQLLLQGRKQQYLDAEKTKEELVFFDRGIPDIEAYLIYSQTEYPSEFSQDARKFRYDSIFYFKPWKEIYESDNERYETFEQLLTIDSYLIKTYHKYNYSLIDVPCLSIEQRVDFILQSINES